MVGIKCSPVYSHNVLHKDFTVAQEHFCRNGVEQDQEGLPEEGAHPGSGNVTGGLESCGCNKHRPDQADKTVDDVTLYQYSQQLYELPAEYHNKDRIDDCQQSRFSSSI